MKVRFFQRLGTRLSVFPLMLLLFVFISGGIAFYFSGYADFLKNSYKLHLINLLSEKRLVVDSWFSYYREDIEGFSKLSILRENAAILSNGEANIRKAGIAKNRRKMKESLEAAQMIISRILEEKASSGKYKQLSLISPDGKVMSSSMAGIAGEDWSERPFLKENAEVLKSTLFIGFNADNTVDFITPVHDAEGNRIALLYALSDAAGLTGFLRPERDIYRTERIEIIDSNGVVILTKDGIPVRKIRYNIPKDTRNTVGYKDGVFFYVADLQHAPFRLIGTVRKSEVSKPFEILLIGYVSFACLILILAVMQNSYFSSKLISRPVARLTGALKSVVSGDMNVSLGKDYTGELLELKKSFENMIEELKRRETTLRENIRTKEKSRLMSAFFGKLSQDMRTSLQFIANGARALLDSNVQPDSRRTLEEILYNSRSLLQIIDDMLDVSRLEEGKITVSPEEFNMCDLLRELEESARFLIGTKEIELVVDCQDIFENKPVYTDRQRLKKILAHLLSNAIKSTEVGTVTVLASTAIKEGVEYLEISVADTGAGIEPEMSEKIFEEFSDFPSSLGLIISKKLTLAMGGKIEVEGKLGKGSVFTVTIPIKAIVYP